MAFIVFRPSRIIVAAVLASGLAASGQTSAKDLRSALPATLTPGVKIAYADGSGKDESENSPSGIDPVKTYVFADDEKFYVENDLVSFLKLSAQHPAFFDLGTEFKIGTVTFGKKDVDLILIPQAYADSPGAGRVGAVKIMIGLGYQAKSPSELVSIITQMLKVGSVQTIKVVPPSAKSVNLDCVGKDIAGGDDVHMEVVFDESAQTAKFEMVGTNQRMIKATFSDAEIIWRDNNPGMVGGLMPYRYVLRDYALSRSTGILIVKRILDKEMYSGNDVHYACSVRSKKF